jgi:competence protein ComEA
MPDVSRRRVLAYAAAVLLLLILGARFVARADSSSAPVDAEAHAAELTAEPQAPRELVVHVVGAVAQPGLYRLREGSRVDDAIQRAGGARPRAALELVNLAAPVADGQQVVVPLRGAPGAAAGSAAGDAAAGGPGGRVHLNTATVEELDALPGVGPVTAQQIVDYRAEKGAFSSVDELDAVPGIGPARLEQLRELVDL